MGFGVDATQLADLQKHGVRLNVVREKALAVGHRVRRIRALPDRFRRIEDRRARA